MRVRDMPRPGPTGPGMPGPYGSIVALVMELVEGEDLSAHIAPGAIPIAEALETAHEQGFGPCARAAKAVTVWRPARAGLS